MLKRIPPFYVIAIVLIITAVLCVMYPGLISYYLFCFTLLIASVLMVIHLFLAWARLAVTSRLGILLCIVAWLGMFYGLIYTDTLPVWKFFS